MLVGVVRVVPGGVLVVLHCCETPALCGRFLWSEILVRLGSPAMRFTTSTPLVGLPWMTGPVLVFLAMDKGLEFAVAACTGIELGVICVAAFMLAYGAVSTFSRWPASVAAGAVAFGASALAMKDVALSLPEAAAAAAASLVLAYLVLPRPRAATVAAALPW